MSSTTSKDQTKGILDALSEYHRCMVDALSEELDRILAPTYSLVHITRLRAAQVGVVGGDSIRRI
jgi:hypothetical protein